MILKEPSNRYYNQTSNGFNELANGIEWQLENENEQEVISLADAEKFLRRARGYSPKDFHKLKAFISIAHLREFMHENAVAANCYYSSLRWEEMKSYIKEKFNYTCQRCGATKNPLHVHHKTYENFGNEDPSDLELLCRECHTEHHRGNKRPAVSSTLKMSRVITKEEINIKRMNS